LEAEALALMVVEAYTLLNHETNMAIVVPVAVTIAVVEGFNCQETKLSRRGGPEK
jgi:hypothetical protein